MKRYWPLAIVLICTLILPPISTALARTDEPGDRTYRLRIDNRSGTPVSLELGGIDVSAAYRLTVNSGQTGNYDIQAGTYKQITTACGTTATGLLRVNRQLKLVFTSCYSPASNAGAPSLEKIHLTDAPTGLAWFYRYGGSRYAGAYPSGSVSGGTCELNAVSDVTLYYRPSTGAEVFSVQPAGFTQTFGDRTSDGWLGFDPGVAQAANIGSFRLRWIPPNTPGLSGDCINLRIVWGPPPGVCFDQTMMEGTKVYASPDTSSDVLAALNVGDFAAITGVTADGDWAYVDLGPGNTGSTVEGWVESSTLNVNGPCDDLPTVTP